MIHIQEHTLQNGLKIYVNPDNATPLVTVCVCYRCGSRNERRGLTGIAHLLEHTMFTGSGNAPKFDAVLQRCGGQNNAFTTEDLTCYHETLPAENIETALFLEADRMCGLLFDNEAFDTQKNVVVEEFKQRFLNRPYADFLHLMCNLTFPTSSYNWPVIGVRPEDISGCSREQLTEFYHSHYAPNNAVLAVSGNVNPAEVVCLAEKYFGGITHKALADEPDAEPAQTEAHRKTVVRQVPSDALFVNFRTGNRMSRNYYLCDFVSDLLADGDSSRLVRDMFYEKKLCAEVDVQAQGLISDGLMRFVAGATPGATLESIEECYFDHLKLLSDPANISDAEMAKVKNSARVADAFDNVKCADKAEGIATAAILGDVNMVNTDLDTYASITKEEVADFVGRVLVPRNSNVLYYKAG